MNAQTALALLLIATAGMALAVQAPLNAALGRGLQSGLVAAAISFGVGFVALLAVALAVGDGPAFARVPQTSAWLLTGGVFGAFYVWSIIWGVPVLGVVSAISALILGQLIAALLLDAIGPFGLSVRTITWPRIAGAAMVAGGLVLSRL